MLIYITGLPGTGKTTLIQELKKRNLEAYSSDEDGFNAYYDRLSGKRHEVLPGVNHHTPEWESRYEWKSDRTMVEELKNRTKDRDIFLAGIVSNQNEIWDLFDIVYYLHIDEATLRHRLKTRTNNSYGKAQHELDAILKDRKDNYDEHKSWGATIINASQTIEQVANDITESVREQKI